jgi:hypothetical protein
MKAFVPFMRDVSWCFKLLVCVGDRNGTVTSDSYY